MPLVEAVLVDEEEGELLELGVRLCVRVGVRDADGVPLALEDRVCVAEGVLLALGVKL